MDVTSLFCYLTVYVSTLDTRRRPVRDSDEESEDWRTKGAEGIVRLRQKVLPVTGVDCRRSRNYSLWEVVKVPYRRFVSFI